MTPLCTPTRHFAPRFAHRPCSNFSRETCIAHAASAPTRRDLHDRHVWTSQTPSAFEVSRPAARPTAHPARRHHRKHDAYAVHLALSRHECGPTEGSRTRHCAHLWL